MSQLISEINRYRNLMGLQELNEVLLTNKNNKNLLVESSIKAKFNFPKVEFKGKKIDSFDQLKNYAISKGITDIGLKKVQNQFILLNMTMVVKCYIKICLKIMKINQKN